MKKVVFFALILASALYFSVQAQNRTVPVQQSTFTDPRDGQRYRTIKKGHLTWMAQNLNHVTDNSLCYENNPANCARFGRLYVWDVVARACPAGWRVPTEEDWDELIMDGQAQAWYARYDTHNELYGDAPQLSDDMRKLSENIENAATRLKSKTGWQSQFEGGASGGLDEFGFSAIPGGYGSGNSDRVYFSDMGVNGYWWSGGGTQNDRNEMPFRRMHSDHNVVMINHSFVYAASGVSLYSIRCVQDDGTRSLMIISQGEGTVSPATLQTGIAIGRPFSITATPKSGYEFVSWRVIRGQAKFANANSATTTVTLTLSTTIAATFRYARPTAGSQFSTSASYSTITDSRDRQSDRTVRIGNRTWMAQNLNFATKDSYCYDNDNSNCQRYGRMYTWDAAMKACPAGWSLPNNADWEDLAQTSGGVYARDERWGYGWTGTGKKLKSKTGWINNGGGTDDFGFSALPGGGYGDEMDGMYFGGVNGIAYWWSATEQAFTGGGSPGAASLWTAVSGYDNLGVYNGGYREFAYSVRCVQNDGTFTLGIDRTPNEDGTFNGTATAAQYAGITAGKAISITATPTTGYAFSNWAVKSGQAQIANMNSATTTIMLSSNASIFANFRYVPPAAGSQFNPNVKYTSIKDSRDGKTYRTVKIGNRTWMAENLNFVADSSWCYEEDNSSCAGYGRLYSQSAAMTACPVGWILPDTAVWNDLITIAGGRNDAGKKLRARRGWFNNSSSTDDFGFSALPGGSRSDTGSFSGSGNDGHWWGMDATLRMHARNDHVDVAVRASQRQTSTSRRTQTRNEQANAPNYSREAFSVRCVLDNIHTLTVNRTPRDGGTISMPALQSGNESQTSRNRQSSTPENQLRNVVAGTPVSVAATPAEGYKFANWTVTSGQARFANANATTTTVTLSSNAEIAANFVLQPGNQFNSSIRYGSFTDPRDRKSYRTVQIGDLTWMAENLNFTADSSWCDGNNPANCATTGRLYTWGAAVKACPVGWSLPDTAAWNNLYNAVGGRAGAGKKLGSATAWKGTDDFGFSALPGGSRDSKGEFKTMSGGSIWWTSGEHNMGHVSFAQREFVSSLGTVYSQPLNKSDGYFVRCIQGNTLVVNRNPTVGGVVTPATMQANLSLGRPINISATSADGYAFANWTVTSGRAQIANANSAITTVTLNSNAVVTAHFVLQPGGQFNPSMRYSSFTDTRDSQVYRTVKIGRWTWMAQNLNFATDSSWCYDNNTVNCAAYGRLYTWDAAMKGCPAGWRLPDTAAWNDLAMTAGGQLVAGARLKSKAVWDTTGAAAQRVLGSRPGTPAAVDNGADEFGFSALPSGSGMLHPSYPSGVFFNMSGTIGMWWSSTEQVVGNNTFYWNRSIMLQTGVLNPSYGAPNTISAVRCIQE